MKKQKKVQYKSLTHALSNLRTGLDFNHFQITTSRKKHSLSHSLMDKNSEWSPMRSVQEGFDIDVVKPFIKEILNYPDIQGPFYNEYGTDEIFTNKLIEAFKKSGFEAQEMTALNDTWIWLRIPNTDYTKLEEQLKIIASNIENNEK